MFFKLPDCDPCRKRRASLTAVQQLSNKNSEEEASWNQAVSDHRISCHTQQGGERGMTPVVMDLVLRYVHYSEFIERTGKDGVVGVCVNGKLEREM